MNEEIRKAIIAMMEGKIPIVSAWCKVKAVNGKTCDVIIDDDEGLLIKGILIGYDKSGVVVKPKLNTDVLVLFVTKTSGAVVMIEQTEDVEIFGSGFSGLVKVGKLKDKLNAIENKVNALISAFNSHVHPVIGALPAAPPVPPTTSATLAPVAPPLTPTEQVEIENEKVKHGAGN
ncbi:MAG: hypothetical protein JNK73_13230 [Bacteroidia bacterium]|nr:hypothetical protein [Bacteroidia bacterium]